MNKAAIVWFVFFLSITAAYQGAYCATMTRGDLTGLFFSGPGFPHPPGMPHPGYVYPEGAGYDGQFYRLLARDPLGRKGYWIYMDDPRYRSRRILVPALAAVLGQGSPRAVDLSYVAITDILMALGGICFIRLAKERWRPWPAALLYLLIPAVIASTDRMVLDGPVVAGFLAAWLFLHERRTLPLMAVLVLLPLAREAAICVTAGVVLVYSTQRRYPMAALAATSAIPAMAWWWSVAARTQPSSAAMYSLTAPLWGQILRLFRPFPRPLPWVPNFLLGAMDEIACVCLLIAFGWLLKVLAAEIRAGRVSEELWLVLPSAALAAVAGTHSVMDEAYAFMRVDSILIAWAALRFPVLRGYSALYLPAGSLALLIFRAGPFLRLLGR